MRADRSAAPDSLAQAGPRRRGGPPPTRSAGRRPDWGAATLAAATGLLAGCAGVLLAGWGGRALRDGGPYLVLLLLAAAAAALGLRAAASRSLDRRTRRAWRIIASAALVQGFAAALWYRQEVAGPAGGIGAPAGVVFLAVAGLLLAGLLTFPPPPGSQRDRVELWLDVLTVGAAAAMAGWYLVVGPMLELGQPGPAVAAVAYPLGGLLLVAGVAAALLRGVPASSRRPLRLLLAAVLLVAAAGGVGGYLAGHGMTAELRWMAPVWLAGGYLLAVAGYDQHRAATRGRVSRAAPGWLPPAGVLPYAAVLLADSLLLYAARTLPAYPVGGLVAGAVVLTGMVVLRQLTALRDNRTLTLTDGLTGLANRGLLQSRLEAALEVARRDGTSVAVLLLDLDRFKAVNDTLGHEAGDAVLVAVGHALRSVVRGSDTAARLGGDEFAVIIDRLASSAAAVGVAKRILAALAAPVVFDGHLLPAEASIGVAVSGGEPVLADELVKRADRAMYAAKQAGTGGYQLYHPDLSGPDPEEQLRLAIDRDELVVHYQPVVHLDTVQPVGVEALVRWQHPTRGLLPPGEFIEIAETSGLIVPLGIWVLRNSCEQLQRWRESIPAVRSLDLNVNVSARQVRHPGFVAEITAVLAETGFDPHRLVLELTESGLLGDDDATTVKLEALRGLGVRIAVDDFGTGYSTLSYLRRLPVDVLKIDRSFIQHLLDNEESWTIGEAVVNLGRALQLEVVAEGIENDDQLRALRELRCSLGQGFHFSRPQEAASLAEVLAGLPVTGTDPARSPA